MAITTLEQAKLILQISTTTKNDLISALIPLVEDAYEQIRNKPFDISVKIAVTSTAATADGELYIEFDGSAEGVEVKSGDTAAIVAMKIYQDLYAPYYYKKLSGVNVYLNHKYGAYQEITFDANGTGTAATITENEKIYPAGSELTAIKMIGYSLQKNKEGKTSESLGDYSVAFDVSPGLYPKSITGTIQRFGVFV